MRTKLSTRKAGDTTVVEYFKIKKPYEFRYKILKGTLDEFGEAVMFIDTNTRMSVPEKRMEAAFDEGNVEYEIFKINVREKRILGLALNAFRKPKPKLTEKFIIAKINPSFFTEEFFTEYVSTYDIAFGFGCKLRFKEIAEDYRENIQDLFFDKEFFEEFMYDSIIFATNRSTTNNKELAIESESQLSV